MAFSDGRSCPGATGDCCTSLISGLYDEMNNETDSLRTPCFAGGMSVEQNEARFSAGEEQRVWMDG
jgi:hypothetical protein